MLAGSGGGLSQSVIVLPRRTAAAFPVFLWCWSGSRVLQRVAIDATWHRFAADRALAWMKFLRGILVMSNLQMFGGKTYNNPTFKAEMNKHYATVDAMNVSIKKLRESGKIDLATMLYGQYQPILAPEAVFPLGNNMAWLRGMGFARVQLSAQPNTRPLSDDQPDIVPLTKCDLLDACLRKCFNSDPPIPITIDVMEKQNGSSDQGIHDVKLVWDYPAGSKVPSRLHFTMICPFLLGAQK
jgi:hypothetical protein